MRVALKEYLKLVRLHHAGLTSCAPLFGAVIMGARDGLVLALLLLIGFLFHVYGFVMNDCMDAELDAMSRDLNERPLVRGTISRTAGFLLALGAITMAAFLSLQAFGPITVTALLLAALFGALYNVAGKAVTGMDIALAASIFFLVLTGSLAVPGSLTSAAVFVALLGGIQVLGMNVIYGGLKDAKHDAISGARTVAVRTGVRIHEDNRIQVTPTFKNISYLIQMTHVACAFIVIILLRPRFLPLMMGGFLFIAVLLMYTLGRLLDLVVYQRSSIRERIALYVTSSHMLAVFVLVSKAPVLVVFLGAFPMAWFFLSNMVLYRTALNPHTQ